MEPGWRIDGAYVESRGPSGDIRFTVTAVPRDHGLSRLWYLLPKVQYNQDFVSDFRQTIPTCRVWWRHHFITSDDIGFLSRRLSLDQNPTQTKEGSE